jgi:error-prone DNA polymerase
MAISEIAGMSEAEKDRIVAEQPFSDLVDFYLRARPSRRTLERLALIGALDSVAKIENSQSIDRRGDLMVLVRQLSAKPAPKQDPHQLGFDFKNLVALPNGNQGITRSDQLENELAITGVDFSHHQLEQFQQMLDDMGVIKASELVSLRGNTEVLVAGVRIATQTPPMRSGKRVVFISLDDGTGCADATFFDEAQRRCAHLLFQNRLLLISGKTRRTGVRGVSILAENAWDLRQLWQQYLAKAS